MIDDRQPKVDRKWRITRHKIDGETGRLAAAPDCDRKNRPIHRWKLQDAKVRLLLSALWNRRSISLRFYVLHRKLHADELALP